jgi:WD40 repeat protein
MTTSFGPWTTAMHVGSNPQLSAFWKRRITRLLQVGRTHATVTRLTVCLLLGLAAVVCVVPTLCLTAEDRLPSDQTLRTAAYGSRGNAVRGLNALAVSPNGVSLAVGGDAHRIELWDLQADAVQRYFDIPKKAGRSRRVEVKALAFSPDGRMLAAAGGHTYGPGPTGARLSSQGPGWLRVWNVETGKAQMAEVGYDGVIDDTQYGSIEAVAFSPDGELLAVGGNHRATLGSEGFSVRLWDVKTGRLRATLTGHKLTITGLAFAPDGRRLATSSLDSTVRLWDVGRGELLASYEQEGVFASCVAFSPDGRHLAVGTMHSDFGVPCDVLLLDAATGELQTQFQGHERWVTSVAFSPDGRILASGGHDNTVRLWDVSNRRAHTVLSEHKSMVTAVAFSPDGQTLASVDFWRGVMKLWRIESPMAGTDGQ